MTTLRGRRYERGEKTKKRTTADVLREIDTELMNCNMNFPEKQEALRIVRNKLNEAMGGVLGPYAPPIPPNHHPVA